MEGPLPRAGEKEDLLTVRMRKPRDEPRNRNNFAGTRKRARGRGGGGAKKDAKGTEKREGWRGRTEKEGEA